MVYSLSVSYFSSCLDMLLASCILGILVLFDQQLALKRLIDISMGVITPLSEQLTKPLPNAMVLVNLKELSTGAYKLLPEG